ncbi:hypothetical protein COCMIDRAFT_38851 [Bipolaris oryzae ATCC 44560]|uniref:Mitochondrial carrier n=1 Tax=Bipolaris oryzae ATCC 44560 TaxID=930090 RepID=W6Z0H6_COCMI|nr:uncharacterized protein COCMIDRAFT_38851 [Bipolaris oryzae ATCC 44560]EUC43178.1 hypothetical protein COCMIDRAFT_38851 [Bipolaris oryzae ATCC 44560]
MSSKPITGTPGVASAAPKLEKKPVKFSNLLLGAGLNIVTTLGQPLEVVKTTMAANRSEGFSGAIGRIWARGGVLGFYQGLIPWAWIEASTKGAVLLFVASEAEYYAKSFGAPDFLAGISGGMTGGLAQAYATMGFCTCMKTVEITKHKVAATGAKPPGTLETFMQIWRTEGIRGINRGVNAVAVRQVTNWGSRFGLSRVAETGIRKVTNKEHGEKLSVIEKITASALGGGLSAWNQPIEVIRVELQSKTVDPNRPKNLNVASAFKYIYSNNGIKGLYRGVTPRIGLGVWQTVCMVALGDVAKEAVEKLTGDKFEPHTPAPLLCAWRCDLTAFSQRHNLYFLAATDILHVYQPGFPDQSLTKEPSLALHPPQTGHRGQGIDPWEPHSINRVLVEYLGNEEILLVTCDDGDVIGYRTEVIYRALQRQSDQDEPASEDDVHIFLHQNVGASAWGLAVHREARIIAISANTYRITVIAYALPSKSTSQSPFCRRNETIFHLSTTNNLPSLSFYGSSGRWLLSSCINGKTILWDLHTRKEAASYQMGWCRSAENLNSTPRYEARGFTCNCPAASSVLHGAWGTIALDTTSAYYLPPAEEDELKIKDEPQSFRDATAQKKRFGVAALNPCIPYMEPSESEDEQSDLDEEDTDSMEGQTQGVQPLAYVPGSLAPAQVAEGRDLDKPFLILTKEEFFLVQRPFVPDTKSTTSRIVSMRRPLHPGEWIPSLATQDRHCYFSQIPELGIFIVGSPIGRAAIFSLYWTRDEGSVHRRYGFKLEYLLPFKQENENQISGAPIGRMIGVAVSPVQGLFDGPGGGDASAEREQGVRLPRRWRILMYYMDHTVLSFELSKPRESESPDLEELVV